MSLAERIRTQLEYYLSDKNLETDAFFHSKITENPEGWLDIDHIMNCKKLKTLSTDRKVVADSIEGSKEVEISEDQLKIRRIGNSKLPELKVMKTRKRDQKEQEKKEEDAKGELNERHFKNPKILAFSIEAKEKANWRDLEKDFALLYPSLRILYSRADEEQTGHLAVCNLGLNQDDLDKLYKTGIESLGKQFTFKECDKEELNKFWADHGTHYQMCAGQKLRRLKKLLRDKEKDAKRKKLTEKEKTFTIAGITYSNSNKVKAKAKAIIAQKKDGEVLEGYEEEFMKHILGFHERAADKLKDFSHFTVGKHPEFKQTRCFLVVRKSGEEEDFSVSKCIENMENKS